MKRSSQWCVACTCTALFMALTSCGVTGQTNSSSEPSNDTASPIANNSVEAPVERVKPAPGTGNVQGSVFYNGEPVQNIEVKLCEEFSQFVGGCDGEVYTARTDSTGEYVITNVPPKVYAVLLARVFDTDSYIFATSGAAGISSAEYEVTADKTLFAEPTHLFKGDLSLVNPAAGATIGSQNLELSWQEYPAAAYYKINVYPEEISATSRYINERVDGTSFSISEPLPKGTYRWQVEAFNSADQKLAESSNDIKFTVN